MERHENCLLCDVGWPRDDHPDPRDMLDKRDAWSTEAEDVMWPRLPRARPPRSTWGAYMEATLDMAFESVWGRGGG